MKKWLRKGLIFFLCLAVLFSFVWFVLVDLFIERIVEKYGTDIVGAKVELDNADVTLFPVGFALKRLQVTDPYSPMTNALEIERIACSVDGIKLLRRQVIIDEMTLDKVRFNTSRKESGAIPGKLNTVPGSLKKRAGKVLLLPSLEIPDVNEILEKEDLRSVALAKLLRNDIRDEKERWKKILKELPDKEMLDEYKKRVKALESAAKGDLSGIIGGIAEASVIKKDIESDLKQIQSARREFETRLAHYRKRMDEAIEAPQEDIRRLKDKYSLSPRGLENLTRLLLGPKIGELVDKAVVWHEKLKPIMERVKDKEDKPEVVKPVSGNGMPYFLIRKSDVSVKLKIGDLAGKIKNITPDQDVLRIPLTFIFSGGNLKNAQSAEITGTLDHINPLKSHDIVKLHLKGCRLRDIKLSDQKALPVIIKEGLLDLKLNAEIKGEVITSNIVAGLNSIRLETSAKESAGLLVRSISSALADVSRFTLKAEITGTPADYETQITSDLDRIMKKAVGNIVKEQSASLEEKLKAAIFAKTDGPVKDLKGSFAQLLPVDNELSGRLNTGMELLNAFGIKNGSEEFKLPF